MEWPENITHNGKKYIASLWRNRIVFYKPLNKKRNYSIGRIKLPDGWQDMDRTWTAQDIYWEDKYDCLNVRSWATLILVSPTHIGIPRPIMRK